MAVKLIRMAESLAIREQNTISVRGRLNALGAQWLTARLKEARNLGFEDFVLDLSACESAFPDGIVPVAALVTAWRTSGLEFELVLPQSDPAARLFTNSNFAHFIQPDVFRQTEAPLPRHVPIRQYSSHTEHHVVSDECVRVAMNSMTASRDVLQGLEWSVNEVMDNVITHAEASSGGFAQMTTLSDRVAFTVADCGRGILTSLQEGMPQLRRDVDAIGEAVKAGVTRNPEIGQGNGLAGTLRIATMSGGSFTVISGSGMLSVFTQDGMIKSQTITLPWHLSFPGTIVSAQIFRSAGFKMAEALGFTQTIGGMFDLIEKHYETTDGASFMIRLGAETTGFGSRPAGLQIRTKLENLLTADPAKPLVLDWEGVPVISSSFADEVLGKLFVKLGALEFSARIRNVRMEALVRGLADKAILQRAAQSFRQPQELEIQETESPSQAI